MYLTKTTGMWQNLPILIKMKGKLPFMLIKIPSQFSSPGMTNN